MSNLYSNFIVNNTSTFTLADFDAGNVLNYQSLVERFPDNPELWGEDPNLVFKGLKLNIKIPLYGVNLSQIQNNDSQEIESNSIIKSKLIPLTILKNDLLLFFKNIRVKLKIKPQILLPENQISLVNSIPSDANNLANFNGFSLQNIEKINFFYIDFTNKYLNISNLDLQYADSKLFGLENHVSFDIVLLQDNIVPIFFNLDLSESITYTDAELNEINVVDYTLETQDLIKLNNIFDTFNFLPGVSGELNLPSSDLNNKVLKIGAKNEKVRAVKTKSIKKVMKDKDNKISKIPKNIFTTGKLIQNNKSTFNDSNTLEDKGEVFEGFNYLNSKLSNVYDVNDQVITIEDNEVFYLNYKNKITVKNIDQDYDERFLLHNTKIYDLPYLLDETFKTQTKLTQNSFDELISEKSFEEKYEIYDEGKYDHVFNDNKNTAINLENDTLDQENLDNYNIKNQKQIKIVLDFKESVDLHLINTKFTFNKPPENVVIAETTPETSNYEDVLSTTSFFNFIKNDSTSYSSHFMPTAYWNFDNNRWSYLDSMIVETDSLFVQQQNDIEKFSDITQSPTSPAEGWRPASINLDKTWENTTNINESITKFDLLGAKNNSVLRKNYSGFNNILSNFPMGSSTVNEFYLSAICKNQKPILTTPSYRQNNGIILGSNYKNKSFLSQITSSYGFPYKVNWQPRDSHLLDMSKYLTKDFLLEKVIIKGTFSMKGEIPNLKGNFASEYNENNLEDSIDNEEKFTSLYDYKDNHSGLVSNNITFFILNEKKNIFSKNKFNTVSERNLQTYSYFYNQDFHEETDNVRFRYLTAQKSYNSNHSTSIKLSIDKSTKLLKNYLGDFSSYEDESVQTTRKVLPFEVLNINKKSIDEFNNLSYESYFPGGMSNLNKNVFLYLHDDNLSQNLDEDVDDLVIKSYESVSNVASLQTVPTFNFFSLDDQQNISTFKIKSEGVENLNENTSRELITYSNILVTSKYNDVSIDNNILKNVDYHYSLPDIVRPSADELENDLNLNTSNPVSFKMVSKLKNIKKSEYTDESVYKIKSNKFDVTNLQNETIQNHYNINNVLEGSTLGQPSNLDISSDRIYDIDSKEYDIIKNKSFDSASGKNISNNLTENNVTNANYVIKPEDRLVLGVTSYANGESLSTIAKLHDKLEIIFVGRDHINEDIEYKNNESDAVRRTLNGSNFINRTGKNLYQSKNNFFDKIYEDKSSRNIEDHLNKKVIGLKTNKRAGSLTNTITFSEKYNFENNIVYKKDTLLPTISNIAFNVYNKNPLTPFYKNYFDVYVERKKEKSLYKIIISDQISQSQVSDINENSVDEFKNIYNNTILDWNDKNIYDNEMFSNLLSIENASSLINSNSFSDLIPHINDIDSNTIALSINYDINSYSVTEPVEYSTIIRNILETDLNENVLSNNNFSYALENNYHTIKSYATPQSSFKNYNHGIKLKNIANLNTIKHVESESRVPLYDSIKLHYDLYSRKKIISERFMYSNDFDYAINTLYNTKSFICSNDLFEEKNLQNNTWKPILKSSMQWLNIDNTKFNYVEKGTNDTRFNTIKNNKSNSSWYFVMEISDQYFDEIKNVIETETQELLDFDQVYSLSIAPSYYDEHNNQHVINLDNKFSHSDFNWHPEEIKNLRSETLKDEEFNVEHRQAMFVNKNTDNVDDVYKIIIPLYHWETLEVDNLYLRYNTKEGLNNEIEESSYSLMKSWIYFDAFKNISTSSNSWYPTSNNNDDLVLYNIAVLNWFNAKNIEKFYSNQRGILGMLNNNNFLFEPIAVNDNYYNLGSWHRELIYKPFIASEDISNWTELDDWMLNIEQSFFNDKKGSNQNNTIQTMFMNKVFSNSDPIFKLENLAVDENGNDIILDPPVLSKQAIYPKAESNRTTPYTVEELTNLIINDSDNYNPAMIRKLIWSATGSHLYDFKSQIGSKFYIRFNSFRNKHDISNQSITLFDGEILGNLNINPKIEKDAIFFAGFNSLNSSKNLFDLKESYNIEENNRNNNVTINEKVYTSYVNKNVNNQYEKTKNKILYKVKRANKRKVGSKVLYPSWILGNTANEAYNNSLPYGSLFNVGFTKSLLEVGEETFKTNELINLDVSSGQLLNNNYYYVEILSLENTNYMFSKNKISEIDLLYDVDKKNYKEKFSNSQDKEKTGMLTPFNNTNISKLKAKKIRVYDDELLSLNNITRSSNYKTENINNDSNFVPYFELNLNNYGSLSTDEYFLRIPYTYNNLVKTSPQRFLSSNQMIPFRLIDDSMFVNIGSPVFYFDSDHIGYNSLEEVDNKSKIFFYGFNTKSQYRLPVEKLEGFKYGVESPVKQSSCKIYFNDYHFGHYADIVMGTLNNVSIEEIGGQYKPTFTVIKKFFNDISFMYEEVPTNTVTNAQTITYSETYNKDIYSRAMSPFVDAS